MRIYANVIIAAVNFLYHTKIKLYRRISIHIVVCLLFLHPNWSWSEDTKSATQNKTTSSTTDSDNSDKGPKLENDLFRFRLLPRTAEQMAAFYEGRGFPESARNNIKNTCFFTAGFRNKSDKVIWLELANWHFYTTTGEVKRLDRSYWNTQWDKIQLPQSSRSTFGWTLLPEERDLQPYESVGGNIVLPVLDEPITLKAYFVTGQNKRGTGINVEFRDIRCARE